MDVQPGVEHHGGGDHQQGALGGRVPGVADAPPVSGLRRQVQGLRQHPFLAFGKAGYGGVQAAGQGSRRPIGIAQLGRRQAYRRGQCLHIAPLPRCGAGVGAGVRLAVAHRPHQLRGGQRFRRGQIRVAQGDGAAGQVLPPGQAGFGVPDRRCHSGRVLPLLGFHGHHYLRAAPGALQDNLHINAPALGGPFRNSVQALPFQLLGQPDIQRMFVFAGRHSWSSPILRPPAEPPPAGAYPRASTAPGQFRPTASPPTAAPRPGPCAQTPPPHRQC